MTIAVLKDVNPTVLVIPRTDQPTDPPTDPEMGVDVRAFPRIRALVRYHGTVTSCALRLWVYDPTFDAWYAGASTDDLDPLTPTLTPVDAPEGREWLVGIAQQITFQVERIEGGGEVEVYARGVREIPR